MTSLVDRVRPSPVRWADLRRRPSTRALTGTLVGNAFGFVLPFAVAAHFGVGRVTDAYAFGLAIAMGAEFKLQ